MLSSANLDRASAAPAAPMVSWSPGSVRIDNAPAAIAATSPTGYSNPVVPLVTTSGRPPVLVPITGTPIAIASRALNPKDSLAVGIRNRSAFASSGATASILPRKKTESSTPSARAYSSAAGRSGPSPTITRPLGSAAATAAKMRTIARTRNRTEIRDVHQHFSPFHERKPLGLTVQSAIIYCRVHEIGNDTHPTTRAAKRAECLLPQELRDRGDAIRFLYRKFGNRMERRILTNQCDVGPMQRRDNCNVGMLGTQHLAGDPRAGCMRYGVVTVQYFDAVRLHHFVHTDRKCEVVRRILE